MILRVACRLDNAEHCSLVGLWVELSWLARTGPGAYFPIHSLLCLGRRSSCDQTGTTSSCRREIKSGYKYLRDNIHVITVQPGSILTKTGSN